MKKEIINCFHPKYIETYHPEFLTDLRVESRLTKNGQMLSQYVDRARKTKPSIGTIFGISNKVTSVTVPSHMHRAKIKVVSTSVTEFHIYQKAGMPKKTRSQMMTELVAKKRQENKNYGTALPGNKNIPKNIPKGG
jgi:hypothetical protein